MITLTIRGTPVAQGRPRFARGRVYDPEKSRRWKNDVAWQATDQIDCQPLEGALEVKMVFKLERPKSSKRRWPTVKPDLSNFTKGIEDALNGIAYIDDCQIVRERLDKEYLDGPEYQPCVEIQIEELEEVTI